MELPHRENCLVHTNKQGSTTGYSTTQLCFAYLSFAVLCLSLLQLLQLTRHAPGLLLIQCGLVYIGVITHHAPCTVVQGNVETKRLPTKEKGRNVTSSKHEINTYISYAASLLYVFSSVIGQAATTIRRQQRQEQE